MDGRWVIAAWLGVLASACPAPAAQAGGAPRAAETEAADLASAPSGAGTAGDMTGASDWTGAYVGGQFGFGLGDFSIGANPAPGGPLAFTGTTLKGWLGGFHLGYNYQLPNRVVLGGETGLGFISDGRTATVSAPGQQATSRFNPGVEWLGTVRGRVGYALDGWLPYVTGGAAAGSNRLNVDNAGQPPAAQTRIHWGWTGGAGVEFPMADNWAGRAEYSYIDPGSRTYGSMSLDGQARPGVRYDPRFHTLMVGLNYRLGEIPVRGAAGQPPPSGDRSETPASKDWTIHGQTTLVWQGYPPIRSPYQGPNSLPGGGEGRETWTATAFIGRRLWEGGELYFNPELQQGFGLADTIGLAAFPNGEAQKSAFLYPHPNMSRLFLRQTFGLGGERETVEDGPNQLAGERDVSRMTVTVGKLAVPDLFLGNAYASDARTQFLNWNIWGGGSFDYAADKVGYAIGAIAELNQKYWALRAGYFLLPKVSNVNQFDLHIPAHGNWTVELETRYSLFSQPGKLRVLGWMNHGNIGSYADAVAEPTAFPTYPDITLTRRVRTNPGLVVNAEQAITDDLGVFSRLSWSPGHDEIMAFTDTHQSLSLGAVLTGRVWGRPADKVGVAGVVEGISRDARIYFASGGTGILIGDGRLTYRREKVFEAYYAVNLARWTTLTFDYQFIANPAYNADRGAVSLFATRVHVEF